MRELLYELPWVYPSSIAKSMFKTIGPIVVARAIFGIRKRTEIVLRGLRR